MNIQTWSRVRAEYENGAPRDELLARYAITDRALSRHIAQEGWRRMASIRRRERLERLYEQVLGRLEAATEALDGTADADKLSKLLTAAEKLDKLSPAEASEASTIAVDIGEGEGFAI